ncbi:hypothetical protein BX600DRAFT_473130 [Xylariales sp. PMI_506]|nr:hypothetical protein BX600DRAFT_473130 [Xylariales sp. PMI_506]
MTSSIKLLGGSLKMCQRDTPSKRKLMQGPSEENIEDIEYILPFLSIMGAWTPFLKTQLNNIFLWDTSPADTDVPDLSCRNARQLQADWNKFFARTIAFVGQTLARLAEERPAELDPAQVRQQQLHLSNLDRWRSVLEVSLARAAVGRDRPAQRAIRLMQLHHQMLNIGVRSCLDPTDMAWDACEDDFLVLVEQCLAFAVETRPARGYHALFTLSMGILSTLGPAIAKCRNHDIRMRALEIARRMPWREGAWDAEAELFGKLGAVLLEERGRDRSGFISAENRWNWIDGNWDRERNVMMGQYIRAVPDAAGNPVVTWLELGLDEWPEICRHVSCYANHAAECTALD